MITIMSFLFGSSLGNGLINFMLKGIVKKKNFSKKM